MNAGARVLPALGSAAAAPAELTRSSDMTPSRSFGRELAASVRLDLAEVLRSRWLILCALVYTVLVSAFVLIGLRESSLLGFTGLGRVLLSFCHALVLLLPLLALTGTGQVLARARDDGALELLIGQSISRGAYFLGVTLVRGVVLVVPLAVLMIGVTLVSRMAFGDPVPWTFVLRTLTVCTALLVAFTGLGLAIATHVRDQARAAIYVLLVWALSVALLDFGLLGLMLRFHFSARAVFVAAALNPVESARLALLSGLEPDLSTLGPVGFYLANRVGATALYALGVVWPALVGVGAWLAALRRFKTGDVT